MVEPPINEAFLLHVFGFFFGFSIATYQIVRVCIVYCCVPCFPQSEINICVGHFDRLTAVQLLCPRGYMVLSEIKALSVSPLGCCLIKISLSFFPWPSIYLVFLTSGIAAATTVTTLDNDDCAMICYTLTIRCGEIVIFKVSIYAGKRSSENCLFFNAGCKHIVTFSNQLSRRLSSGFFFTSVTQPVFIWY